jgi:hypothetical protein
MSTPADEQSQPDVGYYIYGIVPGDVELSEDVYGIGEPPRPVELVRHGDVAALVSPVPLDQPIGQPADLLSHEHLLDGVVVSSAVLPIRFGSVVAARAVVRDDLLAGNHDEFASTLADLRGLVEYVVRARFVEQAVLGAIVSEVPEVAALREAILAQPEELTRDKQVRLGEIVGQAMEANRAKATEAVLDALTPVTAASAIRPPSHEMDAAHVAFLVETARVAQFEEAVEEIARRWQGYATVRLLGPIAPYDFVSTPPVATAAGV